VSGERYKHFLIENILRRSISRLVKCVDQVDYTSMIIYIYIICEPHIHKFLGEIGTTYHTGKLSQWLNAITIMFRVKSPISKC